MSNGYRPAEREDVEVFATKLKKAYLVCRSYGHNALPTSILVVTAAGSRKRYYEQTLVCKNGCGVKWKLLLDMNTGRQISRRPDYSGAPGYLAKGIGRIDSDGKGAMRLEAITRVFTEKETK